MPVKSRRQALSLCLDTVVIAVIQVSGQLQLEVFHGFEFLQIQLHHRQRCAVRPVFRYMPVGNAAATERLPSPEQREEVYRRIREFRKTKAIFSMDFQNDAEYVGAVSTDYQSQESVNHLCDKTVPYAEAWRSTADSLWNICGGCIACGKKE